MLGFEFGSGEGLYKGGNKQECPKPRIFLVQSVGSLVDSVRLDHRIRPTMRGLPI